MLKSLLSILLVSAVANAEIRPEMQKFYGLVEKMQKYTFDKNEYMKKSNEAEIAEALKQFNETVLKIKADKMSDANDMKFRLQILNEGLEEAYTAFKESSKDYSYWALKSSLNQCFSCHTQKSLGGTNYKFPVSQKKSDFLKAEYLYLVRNYDEAIPLFEAVVSKYPKASTLEEAETAVQKILFYFVRVKKDEVATLKEVDHFLQNKQLPRYLQSSFMAWKRYLTVEKYKLDATAELKTPKSLQEYVSSRNDLAANFRMANQRLLLDLDTTQKLFELLGTNKDPALTPWILYYLADHEKDFTYTMFDNSAELYLRECMTNYSKSEAAKKCLKLYREMLTDSFTGSRGTYIPESVQKQLFQYEQIIKGK